MIEIFAAEKLVGTAALEVIRGNTRILLLKLLMGKVSLVVVCAYTPQADLSENMKHKLRDDMRVAPSKSTRAFPENER